MVQIIMPKRERRYSAEDLYRMATGATHEMTQELADEAGISQLNALCFVLGAGVLMANKTVPGPKTRDFIRALADASEADPNNNTTEMDRLNNAMRALCDGVE